MAEGSRSFTPMRGSSRDRSGKRGFDFEQIPEVPNFAIGRFVLPKDPFTDHPMADYQRELPGATAGGSKVEINRELGSVVDPHKLFISYVTTDQFVQMVTERRGDRWPATSKKIRDELRALKRDMQLEIKRNLKDTGEAIGRDCREQPIINAWDATEVQLRRQPFAVDGRTISVEAVTRPNPFESGDALGMGFESVKRVLGAKANGGMGYDTSFMNYDKWKALFPIFVANKELPDMHRIGKSPNIPVVPLVVGVQPITVTELPVDIFI